MSFERPITIKEAIENIHSRKYLLPAIQREFVWDAEQVELLFDSLMRKYPIGSFLFWYVDKSNISKFQFYEFIRDYHERDNHHNPKAHVDTDRDLTAILDGQQRLSALYVGLKGTYSYKEAWKRRTNPDAFPKRYLYLNLLRRADDERFEYDFQFLTNEEAKESDSEHFWFRVGDVLALDEQHKVNDYLIEKQLMKGSPETAKFANKTLFRLHETIFHDGIINFYLEKDEALDKVLNIFIRVNSGGTKLSYSDLLLSIATAQWKHRDAREELNELLTELNKIGNIEFDKDFILKSCLVLCDLKDIAFTVDNFDAANTKKIEEMWPKIKEALKLAVLLASSLGYTDDTLTSSFALIPVAYYLLKKGVPHNYVDSSKYVGDRKLIAKWLALSLLKRIFGGQPDGVLRPVREVLQKPPSEFPLDGIQKALSRTTKSIVFTDEDIEELLFSKYATRDAFPLLALLYPTLDFKNKFHQDHIYPRSLMQRAKLKKRGFDDKYIEACVDNRDYLANLQLLEGVPNREKSAKEPEVWLDEIYSKPLDRKNYMAKNYIPDVDLGMDNFEEFFKERKKLMKSKLKTLLD